MDELGSAPVPPPSGRDHIRGPQDAPLVLEYADFECHFCAMLAPALHRGHLRHVFRHFPVRASHSRAFAAACAAEAAALQGRFWEMHDLLFADQSRLEDPHLWHHAEALGLNMERFEAERRCDRVLARVTEQFRGGVRAGVVTTPTVFAAEGMHAGRAALEALGGRPSS